MSKDKEVDNADVLFLFNKGKDGLLRAKRSMNRAMQGGEREQKSLQECFVRRNYVQLRACVSRKT